MLLVNQLTGSTLALAAVAIALAIPPLTIGLVAGHLRGPLGSAPDHARLGQPARRRRARVRLHRLGRDAAGPAGPRVRAGLHRHVLHARPRRARPARRAGRGPPRRQRRDPGHPGHRRRRRGRPGRPDRRRARRDVAGLRPGRRHVPALRPDRLRRGPPGRRPDRRRPCRRRRGRRLARRRAADRRRVARAVGHPGGAGHGDVRARGDQRPVPAAARRGPRRERRLARGRGPGPERLDDPVRQPRRRAGRPVPPDR